MGTRAVIFGSAPCADWSFLAAYLRGGDYVIAADGGRWAAEALGLTIHWYVGDGDSGGSPEGLPAAVLPTEKAVTDVEAAMEHALQMGCTELILTGCSGGRLDHYLANCGLLETLSDRGCSALLVDECNEVRFLTPGTVRVDNDPPCRYLGLIPLDRKLSGVTLRGLKYPLEDAEILRGTSLAVSNEILPGQQAEITVGEGVGLLIRSERVK